MSKLTKYCLNELGEFKNGANYPKGSYGSGDKIVNVKDLFKGRFINYTTLDELKESALKNKSIYLTQHGDLLFTRSSLVKSGAGMVAMINQPTEDILFCGFIIRFRPNLNLVSPLFLLYLLRSPAYRKLFTDGSVQTNISNINQDTLGKIEVFIPIKEKQVKVISILDYLDSKIELNNRINAGLEAMAKTLYDYWFVQFDFPNANGKPYKTSGGKMVWNEKLKREIPEGWEITKMADWIDSDKSGDWGKEEPEGNFTKKITCIRGADINGLNGLAELKPPVRYILEKNSSKVLNSHDLIVEISGGSPIQSTGRIAFITDATIKRFENPLICSNFCKPISIKNKKLLYNFVFYWNSLYDAGVLFGYEGKTSGIKNLLFDSFVNSYYTVVPDDAIVSKFYSIMENIQEKKQTALAENQHLSSLRDWLLPMLMNGQVTVGESGKKKAGYEIKEEIGMAAEP